MQNLNIILYLDSNGRLIAKHACYDRNILNVFGIDDFENLIGIEYLLDCDDDLLDDSIIVKKHLNNAIFGEEESVFILPTDGTFTYFNFIIPKLDYFQLDTKSETDEPLFFINQDEVFYHNGVLKAVTVDIDGPESTITNENTQIIQIQELPNYLNSHMLSFQKMLFSLCKLQKCLVNLQKQVIYEDGSCGGLNASKKSLNMYNRDFLLSSVYMLEYLTKNDNFEEAQALLVRLNDCSGYICSEHLKSNCNCGSII